MADSLEIVIRAVDRASSVINQVSRSMARLGKMQGMAQKVGSALTSLGQAMTVGATLPIVAGMTLAAKAAIKFESGMADVNKAFGNSRNASNYAQINRQLSQELLTLSRSIPIAVTDLQSIGAEFGKMGVQSKQMRDVLKLAGEMGVAFDIPANVAGEQISKLSNVFGYFNQKTQKLDVAGLRSFGDTINYLADSSASNAGDIVNVLTRIGGATQTFGLSSRQAAGLASAILSLGRPPEVAATAIAGMLGPLQTATKQSARFKRGLSEVGFTAEEFEQKVKTNAMGAVTEFIMKLGQMDKMSRGKAIAQMFGSGEDARTLALLASQTDVFTQSMKRASEAVPKGQTMSAEFQNRLGTTVAQMQLFQNRIFELGVTIGSALLPPLNQLLGAIAPVVTKMAEFAQAHPGIVQIGLAIAGIVAVVGPLLIMLGSLVTAVSALMPIFAAVGTAIAGAFALISAPVAAVVASIALIAAGAYLLITNWSQVSAFFAGLWSGIVAAATSAWNSIVSAVSGAVSSIISAVSGMVGTIISAAASSQGSWVGAAAAMAGAIVSAVAGMAASFGGLVGVVAGVAAQIIGVFQGLVGQAIAAGAAIVQGIASGIMSGIGSVVAAASAVAAAVANVMPKSPPKEGPMQDLYKYGPRITQAIAGGLDPRTVGAAASRMVAPIAQKSPTSGVTTGGGSSTYNDYSTFNIGSGVNPQDFKAALQEHRREIARIMGAEQQARSRVSYG